MKISTRLVLLCVGIAAVLLIGLAVALIFHVSIPDARAERLEHWQFFVSVFEKIGIILRVGFTPV